MLNRVGPTPLTPNSPTVGGAAYVATRQSFLVSGVGGSSAVHTIESQKNGPDSASFEKVHPADLKPSAQGC